jgi:hypothetical protein
MGVLSTLVVSDLVHRRRGRALACELGRTVRCLIVRARIALILSSNTIQHLQVAPGPSTRSEFSVSDHPPARAGTTFVVGTRLARVLERFDRCDDGQPVAVRSHNFHHFARCRTVALLTRTGAAATGKVIERTSWCSSVG